MSACVVSSALPTHVDKRQLSLAKSSNPNSQPLEGARTLPGMPHVLTKEDLSKHAEDRKQYTDSVVLKAWLRRTLGTNEDGWVAVELWEDIRDLNKVLLNKYTEHNETEKSAEETRRRWLYDENEEHPAKCMMFMYFGRIVPTDEVRTSLPFTFPVRI